ncbi:MAG: PAS domain S-box protein [Desulfobacteraceae bacterium]
MEPPEKQSSNDIPRLIGLPFAQGAALLYLLFAGCWIYFSDQLLVMVAGTPEQLRMLSTAKGWLFVCVTALFLFAILVSFTARVKQKQLEIRAQARRYSITLEAIGDGVIVTDSRGRVELINPVAETLTGWPASEARGRPMHEVFSIVNEETRETVEDPSAKVLRDGTIVGLANHTLLLARDGTERPISDSGAPIRCGQEGISGVVLVFRDQTKERRAQAALEHSNRRLQQSEEKYRGLVQHAPAGIYEFDMENLKFTSVNDVMCEYTGYSHSEFLQLDPMDLLSEESRETFTRLVDHVYKNSPGESSVEYKIKGKNNRELWVLSNTRFFYEEGRPKSAMAVVNDLTEIRRAEEERRRLENQLQQVYKMEAIGTLAGGIAHDFNNILAGILGYCQLLKLNINTPEKAKEQAEQIHAGARRASQLVKQILAFSRNSQYEKFPQKLKPIAREVVALLRSSIPATIEIREKFASQSHVLADSPKIHQVLMNLCTNAYHAMREEGGTMSISMDDVDLGKNQAGELQIPAGDYVKIDVTDTGCGMDSETLNKIFHPYFTTREHGQGTGMGLTVVYSIVTEHKGAVKVESRPERGSTFTVYLPAAGEPKPPQGNDQNQSMTSARGSETIMVVEDEPGILESTTELLQDAGYRVKGYTGGKEALTAFCQTPGEIDLVMTDMTMPGMTGETLAKELLQRRPDLPVVMCTGYNENMSEAKALGMGIRRFIEKPVVNRSIAEIIRSVLDEK